MILSYLSLAVICFTVFASMSSPAPPKLHLPENAVVLQNSAGNDFRFAIEDDDWEKVFQYRLSVNISVTNGKLKLRDTSGVLRVGDLYGDSALELFGSLRNMQVLQCAIFFVIFLLIPVFMV